jgi:hypothetical protein
MVTNVQAILSKRSEDLNAWMVASELSGFFGLVLRLVLSGASDFCSFITVSAVEADPIDTWRAGSSESTWLEDDLLRQLPLARVLFYNHFVTEQSGLEELANCLLEAIKRKMSTDNASPQVPPSPLIFLCHSTGGLVVKQALVLAWDKLEMFPLLRTSCIGVAFFGLSITPLW